MSARLTRTSDWGIMNCKYVGQPREDGLSETLYRALGSAIRSRRELLGLSQSSLATRVGMARTTITNIESGGQSLMVHQLADVAHALRMTTTELFEQVGDTQVTESEDVIDPQMENLLMKLTLPVRTNRS